MMLISRKLGESVHIGDNIEVAVLDVQGSQVILGITTPKEVGVVRNEQHWQAIENSLSGLLDAHPAD